MRLLMRIKNPMNTRSCSDVLTWVRRERLEYRTYKRLEKIKRWYWVNKVGIYLSRHWTNIRWQWIFYHSSTTFPNCRAERGLVVCFKHFCIFETRWIYLLFLHPIGWISANNFLITKYLTRHMSYFVRRKYCFKYMKVISFAISSFSQCFW